jgi:hypothetical protein
MRLLVAVESCERDLVNGCHTAIRETWGKDFAGKADVRFFVGSGSAQLLADEIRLDAPDDYESLPFKTKALLRWAVEQGYDYLYKCDTDTCVLADRLLSCGFEHADYTGHFAQPTSCLWPFASGGNGYFLSRRACKFVMDKTPDHWAEDLWVGQVLGPAIYQANAMTALNPVRFDRYVAKHDGHAEPESGRARDSVPQWMREHYATASANGGFTREDYKYEKFPGRLKPPSKPKQPTPIEAQILAMPGLVGLSDAQKEFVIERANGFHQSHGRLPSDQAMTQIIRRARLERQ